MSSLDMDAVAIIGMAVRFPTVDNLEQYWDLLVNGREAIRDLSNEQLRNAGLGVNLIDDADYIARASYLDNVKNFDAEFFEYSIREASIIDPQQRILLELAYEVFEHAAYAPSTIDYPVGVYVGSGYGSYLMNNLAHMHNANDTLSGLQMLIGNDKDYAASRISYKLNLKGPSISVNSACSTSLVAVHQACKALLGYECDMALAGAAKIGLPDQSGYLYQQGGISSKDGHCRPYDHCGSGPVFGNGAGVVLLKRLEDAENDGDYIHAVIRGSAVNNDGNLKVAFTAPSSLGQSSVIADALSLSELDATDIHFVEGHGTSTEMGDPIEFEALKDVYMADGVDNQSCALGSVKANLGHLEAAAGMASLIKAVLSIQHRKIPPLINFKQPNDQLDFTNSPFYCNTKVVELDTDQPIRAGVSSFGIGGTNAHLVLEGYHQKVESDAIDSDCKLLVVSAKSQSALFQLCELHKEKLLMVSDRTLDSYCYSALIGREHYPHRIVFLGYTSQDIANQIAYYLKYTDLSEYPWLEDKTHPKVLQAVSYIQGNNIIETYSERKIHKRMPIPVYPFQKVECWIEANSAGTENVSVSSKLNSKQNVEQKILEIISDFIQCNVSEISIQHNLQNDLMLESLMLAELSSRISREFALSMNLPLKTMIGKNTIADVIECVENMLKGENAIEENINSSEAIGFISNWEANSCFPNVVRIDREWVHKAKPENVLVSRVERVNESCSVAEIAQDLNHEFFYEHPQDHVPALYLIEAARQAGTAVCHKYHDVDFNRKFVLNNMSISFNSFSETNVALYVSIQLEDKVYREEKLERAQARIEFIQSGVVIGSLTGQAMFSNVKEYSALRGERAYQYQQRSAI